MDLPSSAKWDFGSDLMARNSLVLCGISLESSTTAGYDSAAAIVGVKKWLSKRFATRHMQVVSNADLLREIIAVYKQLPRLHIKWVKVEAHLDRNPQTLNEV